MPELGNDNVTGDRYTMNLGVEPDLGNLLQNLQVANDMLDSSEQKFLAIADAVGSVTARLSMATRQTELLAAQTDRLANSYQLIAASSAALGNVGMAAAGGGMPFMPGAMAFNGMPGMMPAMYPAMSPVAAAAGAGGGMSTDFESQGELPEAIPPPPAQRQGSTIPASMRLNQLEELLERFRKMRTPRTTVPSYPRGGDGLPAPPGMPGMPEMPGMPGAAAEGGGALGGMIEKFGGAAGIEGVLGIAAKLAPALMVVNGLQKAYGAFVQSNVEMTRLSGMTGGTGLVSGTGGGLLGLNASAWATGLMNPGVGVGNVRQIQESALSAGLTDGQYSNARDYMVEAYKRGLGDTIDNLDLYEEAVDRAGGTTRQLVGALDLMRKVARNTNASLTVMANNYQQTVERYVGMGFSGGTSSALAAQSATAFAASGSWNPAIRNSGLPDFTQQGYLRAQVTSAIGAPYYALGQYTYGNPQQQDMLPGVAEDSIIRYLNTMGFHEGMTLPEINNANTMGELLGPRLAQLGFFAGTTIDPEDSQAVYSFIQDTLNNRPAQTAINKAQNAIRPQSFGAEDVFMGEVRNTSANAQMYIQNSLSGDVGAGHPLGSAYQNYIARNNETLPIIDQLFKAGNETIANTYVRDEMGKNVPLQQYIKQHGFAGFGTGELEFATLTDTQRRSLSRGNYNINDLQMQSEADFVAGNVDDNQKVRKATEGTVNISDESITRMVRGLANEFDARGM